MDFNSTIMSHVFGTRQTKCSSFKMELFRYSLVSPIPYETAEFALTDSARENIIGHFSSQLK